MTDNEIKSKVIDFLWSRGSNSVVNPPLFSTGSFDSLTFVQMIGFLEKEFNVRLRATIQDFDTLDLIVERIREAMK